MRIYIAGPMTGYAEMNFPAFNTAAARVRALGHEAVNPVEINPDPGMKWEDAMKRDIPELCRCDAIALLPGHGRSRGAKLERFIAESLGLRVFETVEAVPSIVVADDWLTAGSKAAAACRIDDPTCEACQ